MGALPPEALLRRRRGRRGLGRDRCDVLHVPHPRLRDRPRNQEQPADVVSTTSTPTQYSLGPRDSCERLLVLPGRSWRRGTSPSSGEFARNPHPQLDFQKSLADRLGSQPRPGEYASTPHHTLISREISERLSAITGPNLRALALRLGAPSR